MKTKILADFQICISVPLSIFGRRSLYLSLEELNPFDASVVTDKVVWSRLPDFFCLLYSQFFILVKVFISSFI